jgi:hypothetical protein
MFRRDSPCAGIEPAVGQRVRSTFRARGQLPMGTQPYNDFVVIRRDSANMRKDGEEDKVVIGVLEPEAPKVLESSKNSSKDASQ